MARRLKQAESFYALSYYNSSNHCPEISFTYLTVLQRLQTLHSAYPRACSLQNDTFYRLGLISTTLSRNEGTIYVAFHFTLSLRQTNAFSQRSSVFISLRHPLSRLTSHAHNLLFSEIEVTGGNIFVIGLFTKLQKTALIQVNIPKAHYSPKNCCSIHL